MTHVPHTEMADVAVQLMRCVLNHWLRRRETRFILDLSRFRSGLLRAILAIKETGYGNDTQRRV